MTELSLRQDLLLGTAGPVHIVAAAKRGMQPSAIVTVVPRNMVIIHELKIGGTIVVKGRATAFYGEHDASFYGREVVLVDVPAVDADGGIELRGWYSGGIPSGFIKGKKYAFEIMIRGDET